MSSIKDLSGELLTKKDPPSFDQLMEEQGGMGKYQWF
jgi:hypothetical protein